MASKTTNDNEDCRVLESFYTQYGTKLFVKNGVLVEQKLKSPSPVLVDPNTKLIPVPSPYVGDFSRRPVEDPLYSHKPPPPRKQLSVAEIKKLDHKRSIKTAQEALAYYNQKHPKKYVLVRPIESKSFMRNGFWYHCVFLAKLVEDDGDSSERCFFAELKANGVKFGTTNYLVTVCRPIDGTQTTLGCDICDWMPHPVSGYLKGNPRFQPRLLRSSRVPERKRASAGSSEAKDGSGAKSMKGVEGSGGRKMHTFCLEIQDLHKYIPNFDAADNDWMQYM